MNLTSVKTVVSVVLAVVLLPVCSFARSDWVDVGIPSALPEQKSIEIFHKKGPNTLGTYNAETGDLFLSGPRGQIIEGHVDWQGNVTLEEFGGDDGD